MIQPRNLDIIVRGYCEEAPANILLDTGASASLVSTRLLDQLDLISKVQPTSIKIAGLSNQIIPMKGEITLQVSLASTKTQHKFVVCDIIAEDILAGNDLMEKLGLQIDIPGKRVFADFGSEKFLDKPVKLARRIKVKCGKTTTIPANSIGHFNGKVKPGDSRNYEGVVIGYNNLSESTGVCVENALVYSCNDTVPIRCLNPMPFDVTINKNRIVAFMEPVEGQQSVRGAHLVRKEYATEVTTPRLPDAEPEEVTRERGRWDNVEDLYRQLKMEDVEVPLKIKEELKDLIAEFSHCFSRDKFDLGEASFYEAKLELKRDYVAKWVPSREISYKLKPHMKSEVENLVKSGQIERCNYSLWNSCVFLVAKPGGKSYRLVQDMRQLNTQCLPDNYELPKINTIMDKMSECNYLTSFDFTKGFNQIKLDKESRPLTAFSYDGERYQWARLVMGQTSSSSQFARCMAQLFEKVPFQALICFLDDVLIGSMTPEEHLRRLRFVLARLSWGNLKISPSKTQLLRREVRFLGHLISAEGLRIDPKRTEAIQKLQPPTTVKQLQKFLGTLNWNRSFCRNFSSIAAPLYKKLQKGILFNWDADCQKAFEDLKTSLTRSPVLAVPQYDDPHKSYELTIDSSKIGHGATLTQLINGKRRVISYWSKAVAPHMQKFGATRLEFLGLYYSIMHFRIYLEGTEFTVRTDCRPLLKLATLFKNENSYIQRRLADLQSFQFRIEHISGVSKDIQLADYLSRHPIHVETVNIGTQTSKTGLEPAVCRRASTPVGLQQDTEAEDSKCKERILRVLRADQTTIDSPVTLEEIKEEYNDDGILSEVISWLEAGEAPPDINYRRKPAELCHFRQYFDLLLWKDGVLYRRWVDPKDRSKDRDLIVVPRVLIERTLYSFHNGNCHAGADTALAHCRRTFYFYKQSKQFKLYCEACITCARSKQPHSFKRAPLKPIVYSQFGNCLAIDYLEPSKSPTRRGHTALLTMVDMFTNYLVCIPVKSTGSEEAIKVIINEWILKFGVPSSIMHDLGSSFTSVLFKAVLKMFDVRDVHGLPWNSQTNGRAESFNKKINVCMRTCLKDHQWQDYDLWIKYIVFTLNSLRSTKTGYSAHFQVFGKELMTPRDLFIMDDERIEEIRAGITDDDQRKLMAYDLYRNVADVTRKVAENSARKAEHMKSYYDRNRVKGPFFNAGEWCLLLIPMPNHKYSPRFTGPFKIVEKISDWNYIVDVNGERKVTNITKMKIYKPNHFTSAQQALVAPDTPTDQGKRRHGSTQQPTIHPRNKPTESDDDDSSDDGFAVVTRSRSRKRAERARRREQRDQPITVAPTTSRSRQRSETDESQLGDTISWRQEEAPTDRNSNAGPMPEFPVEGMQNEPNLDGSEFRAGEPDVPVKTEPETEEPRSPEQRNTLGGATQRIGPISPFGAIDSRGITLSDIERHERKGPGTSRTTGEGSQQPGRSSSSGHNLRRNPAQRQLYSGGDDKTSKTESKSPAKRLKDSLKSTILKKRS